VLKMVAIPFIVVNNSLAYCLNMVHIIYISVRYRLELLTSRG